MRISLSLWLLPVVLALGSSCFSTAIANDGFYQGAGATLLPVANKGMRVISEVLDLTPLSKPKCYKIIIPKTAMDQKGELIDGASAELGASIRCPKSKHAFSEAFVAKWHAKAVYHVTALEDQKAVQIGFPVPQWDHEGTNSEGLVGLTAPGVVNFRTYVNGNQIKDLQQKRLVDSSDAGKSEETPGFVWSLDFKKGQSYELVTEYDFGVNYTYTMTYPKDRVLWFDKRTPSEVQFGGGTKFSAENVIYFLKPIRLWTGGAPESISVRVVAPNNLSVYYLVPGMRGVDCVDHKSIYFKWTHAFPEDDLLVSYPELPSAPPIRFEHEYTAWIDLVAHLTLESQPKNGFPKLKKTCELQKDLLKNLPASSAYRFWVEHGMEPKCVESCR